MLDISGGKIYTGVQSALQENQGPQMQCVTLPMNDVVQLKTHVYNTAVYGNILVM